MLNRPATMWLDDDSNQPLGWDSDRVPKLRLVMMWLAIALSLLAVAIRMGQLQILLRDEFARGFQQPTILEESIPAREGRILASDGAELAKDVEQYDLQVHYRMIQEPVDEGWLRSEALRQLSPFERKNKLQVTAEMDRVLLRRQKLWASLSDLTGRSPEELQSGRMGVQRRVERIRSAVLRERELRLERGNESRSMTQVTGWQAIWNRIQRELTEPPDRLHSREPLREELDYHTVAVNVGSEVRDEVEAKRELYPRTRIFVRSRRVYPHGELASHLIGHRKPLTAEEIAKRRANGATETSDYREGDSMGRSGLELQYESHLHGVNGVRLVKNRRGEIIDEQVVRKPRHGPDLKLTLDREVQRGAEKLLDEAMEKVTPPTHVDDESHSGGSRFPTCPQSGCLVAVDVSTGAVIAAASAPRFDLNLLVHTDRIRWKELMDDPRKPMFRRVTDMALAPGSVFKIVSAVAAVESGKVDPNIPIHCRGYLDRPDQYRCLIYRHSGHEHGDMFLADALCRSCNVYFFTAARRMGPTPLVDWAGRFGIGLPTGIDLPSEADGHLPQADRMRMGNTLGLVIGQADLTVTPLQMARAVAAIANDGFLITPHLADDVGPVSVDRVPSYQPAFTHPEPTPIAGLHRETLVRIREGLDMVVNDSRGTAFTPFRNRHPGSVRVAGKTGTAETKGGADHAWFAGYVPADHPRVAFVVVLEHGGSGGRSAGPVARRFVELLQQTGVIIPSTNLVAE